MERRFAIALMLIALALAVFTSAPKLIAAQAEAEARRAEQAEISAAVTSDLPLDFFAVLSKGPCQGSMLSPVPAMMVVAKAQPRTISISIYETSFPEKPDRGLKSHPVEPFERPFAAPDALDAAVRRAGTSLRATCVVVRVDQKLSAREAYAIMRVASGNPGDQLLIFPEAAQY
ncbi:MAG: hypothetical protein ABUS48_07355 [Pseudomonadota bacterium]